MTIAILALLVGIVSGLRSMMSLTAVSWAARLGWLPLTGTWAGFLGDWIAVAILTLLAIAELIIDKLPSAPSRKTLPAFGARLITGALAGGALGAVGGSTIIGLIAGVAGAVIGVYGGAELRGRLAAAFGRDLPAALIEDAIGIVLTCGVVMCAT